MAPPTRAPYRLPLLLLAAVALLLPLLQDASALRLLRAAADVCASVREISDFVVEHCDASANATTTTAAAAGATTMDPACVESFEEYAHDSEVFKKCEADAASVPQPTLRRFKELYSTWQQAHVCEIFHATEKKAAHECSGDNVHRPWNEATWPLFCHQTFASYRENRKDIDALCAHTENSPAFWEGYADYIASPTCKQYYDFVRSAARRGCGHEQDNDACVKMFRWYRDKQREVELDCLELHNTKPFYKGFYRWKKRSARI